MGWPGLRRGQQALQLLHVAGKLPSVSTRLRRRARMVGPSVPGRGPGPGRCGPDSSSASVPNASATTSGAWLGSMMPPEPTRMVCVAPAMSPPGTAVAELAMPGMLWCWASQ